MRMVGFLHGLHKGGVAFEAMRSLFADLVKKLIKWSAEHEDLQDLILLLVSKFYDSQPRFFLTEFM